MSHISLTLPFSLMLILRSMLCLYIYISIGPCDVQIKVEKGKRVTTYAEL